eukprot:2747199-Pleurochrysis_carterae.AAC.1
MQHQLRAVADGRAGQRAPVHPREAGGSAAAILSPSFPPSLSLSRPSSLPLALSPPLPLPRSPSLSLYLARSLAPSAFFSAGHRAAVRLREARAVLSASRAVLGASCAVLGASCHCLAMHAFMSLPVWVLATRRGRFLLRGAWPHCVASRISGFRDLMSS